MKKRVLSMFMALVLGFSMLPATVLAEDAAPAAQEVQTTSVSSGDAENTGEGGIETFSLAEGSEDTEGDDMTTGAARVEVGGTVSYTDDLAAALENAEDGTTITLLKDAVTYVYIEIYGNENSRKTITLDLNGYSFGDDGSIFIGSYLNSGTAEDKFYPVTLIIRGSGSISHRFTIRGEGVLDLSAWTGGTINHITMENNNNIDSEPTLIVGTPGAATGHINTLYYGNWWRYSIPENTKLNAGSYGEITISSFGEERLEVRGLLPAGYVFKNSDGTFVEYKAEVLGSEPISNVSVVPCTAHADRDDDGNCDYCNREIAGLPVSVTTADNEVTYHDTLSDAFAKAADDDTVTLLQNVTTDEVLSTPSSHVMLDLNGKTITGGDTEDDCVLFVGMLSQFTICDNSSGKTGQISKGSKTYAVKTGGGGFLTITGGSFDSVNIIGSADISGGFFEQICYCRTQLYCVLKNGYAFADSNGNIVSAYDSSILSNVTVVPHAKHSGSPCACGYVCPNTTRMDDTGHCPDCGTLLAQASVTAGENVTYYTDFRNALGAAQNERGSTVTLLQDVTLLSDNDYIYIEEGTFTIDWNGHTLTGNTWRNLLTVSWNANVTLKDSSGNNAGGVRNTAEYSGSAVMVNVNSAYSVTIEGGTYYPVVSKYFRCHGTFQIKGGVFQNPEGTGNNFALYNQNGLLADLLGDGVTFAYDQKGTELADVYADDHSGQYKTVYVVSHSHGNYNEEDKCACGYSCLHEAVDADNKCTVCGKLMTVKVTKSGNTSYYRTLTAAIGAAGSGTVKLLADSAETGTITISTPLTLDLNGYNIGTLSVEAKATIKDTGTGRGTIQSLTVPYTGELTLGDLLEEGCAFKNDSWIADEAKATNMVTVQQAPITRVTLKAEDTRDENVTMPLTYGTTGVVNLIATCAQPGGAAEATCVLYKLEGGTLNPVSNSSAAYALPADLAAGTHKYRVTFTSDGYSKSAEIIVTVAAAGIADAKVEASSLTYDGTAQTPGVTVSLGGTKLTQDTDYTVDVMAQTNAGSYTLTVTGMGNYEGTVEGHWTIHAKTVNATVTVSGGPFVYDNGKEIQPTVTVLDGETEIPESEYTVSYENNKNAGTAAVIVIDKAGGNYTVSGSTTFKIDQAEQAVLTVTGADTVAYGQTWQVRTSGGSGTGTVTYRIDKATGTDAATIDPDTGVLTPVTLGSVSVIATKAGDNNYKEATSASFTITITQGKPTGAPKYTQITTGGKTLADANLTTIGSNLKPDTGTLEWIDGEGNVLPDSTVVEANKTYQWRFTPEDDKYTALTGGIRLYPVAASSGSGSADSDRQDSSDNSSDTTAPTPSPQPVVTPAETPKPRPSIVKVPATKTEPQTETEEIDSREPYVAGDTAKSGWNLIRNELKEQTDGQGTVQVDMNGATVVPGDIFDSIKGQDIDVVFDMGDGITWTVNGKDITAESVQDIDFAVTVGDAAGQTIPLDVINNVTGERYSMNLSLGYDGTFGFQAVLTVNMDQKNAGLYANLFYYNEDSGKLEFICAGEIGADGNVDLTFSHASDYIVVLDEKSMDTIDTAADGNADQMPQEVVDTGAVAEQPSDNGIWILLSVIAVIFAGVGIFYLLTTKRKKN